MGITFVINFETMTYVQALLGGVLCLIGYNAYRFAKSVTHKLKHIIMTQAELATALGDISTQFQKGIDEVVAAVAASGQTTPDVDAAVAKLRAAAQTLDDINPDAPAPTP